MLAAHAAAVAGTRAPRRRQQAAPRARTKAGEQAGAQEEDGGVRAEEGCICELECCAGGALAFVRVHLALGRREGKRGLEHTDAGEAAGEDSRRGTREQCNCMGSHEQGQAKEGTCTKRASRLAAARVGP